MIRPATAADAGALASIYNHYVLETIVTFEEQPVAAAGMAGRIAEADDSSLPWLVDHQQGGIVGYAYASPWKGRCAYRFSVETTIYLAKDCLGKGIGTGLYRALTGRLKDRGLHAAIGGIALPNAASVALHHKLGFRKVAEFPEVGYKFGRWINVGYWQSTL